MMLIDVYRNDVVTATLQVTEENLFTRVLMGEHKIVIDFLAKEPINVQIGDYILWQGQRYYINTPPEVIRLAKRMMEYNIVFEGREYTLYNKLLLDEGDLEFSYFGAPEDHLLLLLENINIIDPGWTLGTVTDRNPTTITYSANSCRVALSTIAETFGLEFFINDRVINMVARHEIPSAIELEYGKGNGLYSLTRSRVEDKNVVTKLYPFGGTRNLAFDYRGGKRRLTIEDIFITQNTELYGIREGEIKFDNIFPQRTASVTAVEASLLAFTDSTMDFDLNQFLSEGLVAKVVFKSGALAGYEFEITSYNNATKRFTINPFDDSGNELPNSLNKIEVGDLYTLVDINMPQTYIDQAEADLLEAAEEYLAVNSFPRVTYQFDCDEKFIRDNNVSIQVGTKIRVIDEDLGIDVDLRVTELSYPIAKPSRITATISEDVTYSVQERLLDSTVRNINNIIRVERETDQKIAQIATGSIFTVPVFGGGGRLIDSNMSQILGGMKVQGFIEASNFVFDATGSSNPGGGGGGAFIWGLGSGQLSDQNDLQSALNAKANVSHVHDANAITSGTFSANRIPLLEISKVNGLQTALDDRVGKTGSQTIGGIVTFQSEIVSQQKITMGSAAIVTNANEFIVQNGGVNALRVLANRNVSVTESVLAKNFVFDATDVSNPGGGGGAAIWGLIGGDLPNQTDVWNSLQNINASRVNSGTLADARIPNLAAGKITSGVFADARIPNLDASKITSGTFANARISASSVTQHLGNYVTLDGTQTITGRKTIQGSGNFGDSTAARFDINNTTSNRRWGIAVVASGSNAGNYQIADATAGLTRLLIDNAGNIGIGGQTTPTQSLHTNGNIRIDGQGLLIGTNAFAGDRSIHSVRNTNSNLLQLENSVAGNSSMSIGAEADSNTIFSRQKDNFSAKKFRIVIGATERFTMLAAGNVGINETSPAHSLHVGGNMRADAVLINTNTLDAGRSFQSQFSGNNYIQLDGHSNRLILGNESTFNSLYSRTNANANTAFRIVIGTTERFRIEANGNIGVNKTPVSGRALDVQGNIHASGSMFAANFVFG